MHHVIAMAGIAVATVGSANADEAPSVKTITVSVLNDGPYVMDFCARTGGKTECSDKFSQGETEPVQISVDGGASVEVGMAADLGDVASDRETPLGRDIFCKAAGSLASPTLDCGIG